MGSDHALALRRWALAAVVSAGLGMPCAARAQDGLIVQPAIPQGFDRDRNVSVAARPRPDYNPIGISVGGLLFFPAVETSAGGTTNAYLTGDDATEALFAAVEPSLRVASIWSRHSLRVQGSSVLRDYIGQSRRNERTWDLGAEGRLDLGRAFELTADLQSSLDFENQFSGEVTSTIAAVSRFRRDFASLRGEYTSGRIRAFVVGDASRFRFRPLPLLDGSFRDQGARDRTLGRLTGQVEYARSPSVSLFAQLGYVSTRFAIRTPIANRDSDAVRAGGGVNIDLAGRMRGTIGIGYSIRDYAGSSVGTVRGVVAEARLEVFPREALTITATARRTIEDSTFGNRTPFFDNRFSLGADYEVLTNLIVSANGDVAVQNYITIERDNTSYRARTSARYLISRRLSLNGALSYARRRSNADQNANNSDEGRVEAGLTFHI